ncbi:MAG: thioredoxin domain-containing protein, partial [Nanoarchaeota archaeon]
MPCVMMAPVIEDIAERFKESMTFARVNIDDNSEIVERFKISSVPTLLILQNGKEIGRIIGNLPQTFLEEKIEKVLSTIISVQRI